MSVYLRMISERNGIMCDFFPIMFQCILQILPILPIQPILQILAFIHSMVMKPAWFPLPASGCLSIWLIVKSYKLSWSWSPTWIDSYLIFIFLCRWMYGGKRKRYHSTVIYIVFFCLFLLFVYFICFVCYVKKITTPLSFTELSPLWLASLYSDRLWS